MNKNQFKKVTDNIIKLREDLGARKFSLILYGFFALLIVFVLFFAYRPLMTKLGDADRELKSLEAQLLSQRNNVAAFEKMELEGKLMQQKEVSFALDELTEEGRGFGLKFISITPKELQKSAQGNFKKLPVNFKIESEYKKLGQFLAYLEEFPRTIAEVESISIRPREEILPKLDVEALVSFYMEAGDGKE